jgi:GNAT superfamily N-acetyltransferase
MEPILDKLVQELREKHACHTVVLYGSRARGDFTAASDYDVLGIRDGGELLRDARPWEGSYLDAFIYPAHLLAEPPEHLLDLRQGRILLEKGSVARDLLTKLQERFAKGPTLLRADEFEAIRVWHDKAIDRIRLGGLQGDFRRLELVARLLEDYFLMRGEWYLGPKASFQHLERHEPGLLALFRAALESSASLADIEALKERVSAEIARAPKWTPAPAQAPAEGWRPALPEHDDAIVALSSALYVEDPGVRPVPPEQTRRTLAELRKNPVRGQAWVCGSGTEPAGYAFLIYFWSNEVGGEICVIDEVYVKPGSRGKGHGRALFTKLIGEKKFPALDLEVTPANGRARAFYEGFGFAPLKNQHMRLRF